MAQAVGLDLRRMVCQPLENGVTVLETAAGNLCSARTIVHRDDDGLRTVA